MIRNRLPLWLLAVICAAVFATISTALAGSSPKPQSKSELPGVDSDYRIVKPIVPEPDKQASGQFKIGNMDVRIGGSLSVDVGAGSIASPRR